MMTLNRRKFVKQALIAGAVGTIVSSFNVFAAWPEKAYKQENISDALHELFGNSKVSKSDKIHIKVPKIAENGAVVPITVKTSLPNVDSISILVEKNPNPLVARFNMQNSKTSDITTRIKLGKKSNVIAVVSSNGRLYSSTEYVKVTRGGCGG